MDRLLVLQLDNGRTLEAKAPAELEWKLHDICVFRREFYIDTGEIVREIANPPEGVNWADLPLVQHLADSRELAVANENIIRSRDAMRTARDLVESLGLAMKLLNAHYSLDGKLVLIQFSADGRIDFRELVKELSRALCTRIELRQIGVRDETGIYGGIAVCGQPFCCCRFLKEFNSINVKMAKEQDLSLTPATISGVCGRLKCCLKFEYDGYRELDRGMPKRGSWCDTPQGRGRVCDRNLLTQKVSVQLESGNIVHFSRADVTVHSHEQRSRVSGDSPQERDRQGGNGNGREKQGSRSGGIVRTDQKSRAIHENLSPREKAGAPESSFPLEADAQREK